MARDKRAPAAPPPPPPPKGPVDTSAPRRPRGDALARFVAGYKVEPGTTIAQRVVLFLVGLSDVAPGVCVAHNVLAKAVLGLPTTPNEASDKTKMVARAISRAREIARRDYDCSIVVERGIGSRATTGDDDQAQTRLLTTASRFASAHRTFAAEAALVNPEKVKDDKLRAWVKSEVRPTLKMLADDDRIKRLLGKKST